MSDPKSEPKLPNSAPTQRRTLIEEGTRFKGSLSSTCPVVVQGIVEGDVDGPSVTVSATGSLAGVVVTGQLKSDGNIAGDFDVESAQLAGTVAKDTVIRANTLDVKLNVTTGKAQLTFGTPRRN
jgi:cytoskeletal protein CcmA (bactofilin family)